MRILGNWDSAAPSMIKVWNIPKNTVKKSLPNKNMTNLILILLIGNECIIKYIIWRVLVKHPVCISSNGLKLKIVI